MSRLVDGRHPARILHPARWEPTLSNQNDPAEVERLRARLAQLEAKKPSKSGWGFSGGFFGCFGVLAAIIILIVVLMGIGRCSRDVASTTPSNDASNAVAGSSAPADPWVYNSTTDAMNDAKTKTACTTSTNQINQSFPYHNVSAELCIRHSPRSGLDAYVTLDGDGQILCGIESCSVPVRFDKGSMQHFPGAGARDNSSNIIFINRTEAFLNGVKKSSATVVEVTMFQNGSQALTFNTASLKWP